jgi:hypothetical protein
MPRASWRGFLRLSLVSCSIYLSPATTRSEIHSLAPGVASIRPESELLRPLPAGSPAGVATQLLAGFQKNRQNRSEGQAGDAGVATRPSKPPALPTAYGAVFERSLSTTSFSAGRSDRIGCEKNCAIMCVANRRAGPVHGLRGLWQVDKVCTGIGVN